MNPKVAAVLFLPEKKIQYEYYFKKNSVLVLLVVLFW